MILLGMSCIMALVGVQYIYFRYTNDLLEKEFDASVYGSLQQVGKALISYNNSLRGNEEEIHSLGRGSVQKLERNLYLVDVNDYIPPGLLGILLRTEFVKSSLDINFEYAVYDCEQESLLSGGVISTTEHKVSNPSSYPFVHDPRYTYYFQVHFSDRELMSKDSMRLWLVFSVLLLLLSMMFIYLLNIISKQHRLTETQKHFINNITHEFKTPLASISMCAESLRYMNMQEHADRAKNYSELIYSQTNKLTYQIDRILSLLVAPQKAYALKLEEVNLSEFVLAHIEHVEYGRSKEFIQCKPIAEDVIIRADVSHLGNILTNLIGNAIKYSEEGTVIEVSLERSSKGCVLSVKDHGTGIDKRYAKKIFKRFFRIPTGDLHNVKGFGLGLSYVKHFVDLHRWKINIESKLGEGSTFKVLIPILKKSI